MSDSPSSSPKGAIPLFYRIVLLYMEPFFALNGAYLLLQSPSRFLNAISPNFPLPEEDNVSSISSSSSHSNSTIPHGTAGAGVTTLFPDASTNELHFSQIRIITDMLGIMHLVFAFNTAVVLRAAGSDRRMWRVMCLGMLLCDVLHLAVAVREYGGLARSLDVAAWRVPHDWANFGTMIFMTAVRIGVVFGGGKGSIGGGREKLKVR